MTTDELIARLREVDPSGKLEVIRTQCSDWGVMDPDEVSIVRGVKKPSAHYVMRGHETMSDADKAAARDFVHFEGN